MLQRASSSCAGLCHFLFSRNLTAEGESTKNQSHSTLLLGHLFIVNLSSPVQFGSFELSV